MTSIYTGGSSNKSESLRITVIRISLAESNYLNALIGSPALFTMFA